MKWFKATPFHAAATLMESVSGEHTAETWCSYSPCQCLVWFSSSQRSRLNQTPVSFLFLTMLAWNFLLLLQTEVLELGQVWGSPRAVSVQWDSAQRAAWWSLLHSLPLNHVLVALISCDQVWTFCLMSWVFIENPGSSWCHQLSEVFFPSKLFPTPWCRRHWASLMGWCSSDSNPPCFFKPNSFN